MEIVDEVVPQPICPPDKKRVTFSKLFSWRAASIPLVMTRRFWKGAKCGMSMAAVVELSMKIDWL